MENIIYSGWIRSKDFGESDDILYLEGGDYITNIRHDSYEPKDIIPLTEVLEDNIADKTITLSYWVADRKCAKEEAQEQFIKSLFGSTSCEFTPVYTEITGYICTDENLVVGGHDVLNEIRSNIGKFLILDIVIHDLP